MTLLDQDARERAAEARALRARIALGVKMLTTAGYAMIGGNFFKAISEQRAVPEAALFWAAAGLGVLALALWFAPHGGGADE